MDLLDGFIIMAYRNLFIYFDVTEYLDKQEEREVRIDESSVFTVEVKQDKRVICLQEIQQEQSCIVIEDFQTREISFLTYKFWMNEQG